MPSGSFTLLTPKLSDKSQWNYPEEDDVPELMQAPHSPDSISSPLPPSTPPKTGNQSPMFGTYTSKPLSRQNSLREPRTVGALALLRAIGSGAFSKTYRASGYNRIFAVKCRLPSTDAQIFQHEKHVLMKIGECPNVVRLYPDLGDADHLVFDLYDSDLKKHVNFITEEMENSEQNLFDFQRMCKPVITMDLWIDYAHQLTSALKFIHSKNVVHADLKPENILYTNNKLVIADFSAAIDIDSQTASVLAQELGDSLAMSPVYADPKVRSGVCLPSFQSDIYSLGLVLAFCATNEEPYSCAKNATQRMLWMDKIAPIDSFDIESQQRLSQVKPIIEKYLLRDMDAVDSAFV